MSSPSEPITVRSHVGRDLLQSAAVFKHERLVVWEYVSNGLQYIDPGVSQEVRVEVDSRKKRITISDNGRGMNWEDLRNFFLMHGENIDRKQGRGGRGYFGTGKSAAFGIAQTLRVTTIRGGKRSKVELSRRDVESMASGDPVPVRSIEISEPVAEPNGTIIEIEGIYIKAIDQEAIIRYIEKHIAHWPNATVLVNNHICEFIEPAVSREYRSHPEHGSPAELLGGVELIVKVSKAPLAEDQRGIAILSRGVWHETTTGGIERKEMAEFIFGEIDVPMLAYQTGPVPAFDLSRSMQLNRSNDLVGTLLAFIGYHVDQVRRQLVEEERKRKASEDAKRLANAASDIAKIINLDFEAFRGRLSKVVAKKQGGTDHVRSLELLSGADELIASGGEIKALPLESEGLPGRGDGVSGSGEGLPNRGQPMEESDRGRPTGERREGAPKGRRPQGGFDVEFREMGPNEARAKYEHFERVILVNLDHPQINAALGVGGVDDPVFKRLAYEVAFAEYAIGLATIMNAENYLIDPTDAIVEIRDALNRITRMAAHLYRA